jgi:hypothetical protein
MSNHIGDTNKMVDTPRMDASAHDDGAIWQTGCDIERELNAASKERDDALMMLGMYRMKSDGQKDRIKRLEELGKELRECASQLGWTSSDDSRWIERAESAVKAWDKEDKL